jgi:hypothetical protein
MSAASEQDHLNPQNPMYYAPRWLRERPGLRLAPSPEATSEQAGRPASSAVSFDSQLENAVSDALRHPLDPEVVREPPGLAREDRRMALITVAGRFAAAVGVAAIVALFFVIMVPASWQPDSAVSSFSGFIQSMRTAPPQAQTIQTEAAPKSALADFQGILVPPKAASEPVTREQSDALLQGFVQWGQKPAPEQAGEK